MKKEQVKMTVEFVGAESADGKGVEGATHVAVKAEDGPQLLCMVECLVDGLAEEILEHAVPDLPEEGRWAITLGIVKAVKNGLEWFLNDNEFDPEEMYAFCDLLGEHEEEKWGAENGKVC